LHTAAPEYIKENYLLSGHCKNLWSETQFYGEDNVISVTKLGLNNRELFRQNGERLG